MKEISAHLLAVAQRLEEVYKLLEKAGDAENCAVITGIQDNVLEAFESIKKNAKSTKKTS